MVTVYIWDARYAGGSVGHVAMAITGGQPAGATYISWWPAKRRLDVISVGVPRVIHTSLEEDEGPRGEGRKPDHTIQLQGLDETAIKAFWKRWAQNANYQGLLFSCATTVGWALKQGGGDRYARSWTDPKVWTPADLLSYALAI